MHKPALYKPTLPRLVNDDDAYSIVFDLAGAAKFGLATAWLQQQGHLVDGLLSCPVQMLPNRSDPKALT